jgi:FAD dependent oxidoreductase
VRYCIEAAKTEPAATMVSRNAIVIGAGDKKKELKQSVHFCTSEICDMLTSACCRSGVVGLAAARRLAALGYRVTVLETESDSDHHTSARGSWVIHSGLYYPPGSLKVGGMHMLRLRCSRRCIPGQCAHCD